MMSLARLAKNQPSSEEIKCGIDANVQRILQVCRPNLIILFGSAANNTFTWESDFDFLVLFEDLAAAKRAWKALCRQPPATGFPVDILVEVEAKASTYVKQFRGAISEALLNGKVVYDAKRPLI